MNSEPQCLKCSSENVYFDGSLWICTECQNEWTEHEAQTHANKSTNAENSAAVEEKICDAFGTPLTDGDSVTVIKELKIKGSSSVVKVGTKVKSIRLGSGQDGHDISCKIDGLGSIFLKSEFVKKA